MLGRFSIGGDSTKDVRDDDPAGRRAHFQRAGSNDCRPADEVRGGILMATTIFHNARMALTGAVLTTQNKTQPLYSQLVTAGTEDTHTAQESGFPGPTDETEWKGGSPSPGDDVLPEIVSTQQLPRPLAFQPIRRRRNAPDAGLVDEEAVKSTAARRGNRRHR